MVESGGRAWTEGVSGGAFGSFVSDTSGLSSSFGFWPGEAVLEDGPAGDETDEEPSDTHSACGQSLHRHELTLSLDPLRRVPFTLPVLSFPFPLVLDCVFP